jgi:hypothetical protein
LEGLSANARVELREKIDALQPFPIGLTSIRYPLYSIDVIVCDVASSRSGLVARALRSAINAAVITLFSAQEHLRVASLHQLQKSRCRQLNSYFAGLGFITPASCPIR